MAGPVHVYRDRDDYGRSNLVAEQAGRLVAVLVTIPKRTAHLTEGTHFVNHIASDVDLDVTWYPNQRTAQAAFDAIVASHR